MIGLPFDRPFEQNSKVVFGCAAVGGRVSERASLRAMAIAFEAGITSFDVARSYGYGDAERVLGDFLHGRRDRVQIFTKAGIVAPHSSRLFSAAKSAARSVFRLLPRARGLARPALGRMHATGNFEPAQLELSLAASLRALRTDHVDALLLHACDQEVVARDDVRSTLEGFVKRGLARRVGVAAGAREAALWMERGGEPTAELPASELAALPERPAEGLWLANQPLGGGTLLAKLQAFAQANGLPHSSALEFLLRRPLEQGATAVVVSMLSAGHATSAIRAVQAPCLTAEHTLQFERALKES